MDCISCIKGSNVKKSSIADIITTLETEIKKPYGMETYGNGAYGAGIKFALYHITKAINKMPEDPPEPQKASVAITTTLLYGITERLKEAARAEVLSWDIEDRDDLAHLVAIAINQKSRQIMKELENASFHY